MASPKVPTPFQGVPAQLMARHLPGQAHTGPELSPPTRAGVEEQPDGSHTQDNLTPGQVLQVGELVLRG